MSLNESHVEQASLTWLGELGYSIAHGPHLAPGELLSERDSFTYVILTTRLRNAVTRLNPAIPDSAREGALRKVLRLDNPAFLANNRAFHKMFRDGGVAKYPGPARPFGVTCSELSVNVNNYRNYGTIQV